MQPDDAEDRWGDDAGVGRERADAGEAHPDDAELVRRVRGGDGDAVRLLMVRYDRLVRYVVFRLCRAECVRDPTFLDARASEAWTGFVRSVQQAGSAQPRNLKTYLIQIARNKCVDAVRQLGPGAAGQAGDSGSDLSLIEAPTSPSVELLIRAEEVLALRECLEKLSPYEKRICEQMEHLVAGRWKHAAEALGMPESTIRSRWPGIVAKLKACLERKTSEKFAPPPEHGDS